MSKDALVNLATVGSDELQAMPAAVFTSALEHMSAEAIVRFRRMRKLSALHRSALEKYLAEHPDKRPSGSDTEADNPVAKPGKASAKAGKKEKKNKKEKKKKNTEAGLIMEMVLRLIAWWEGMETDDVAEAKGIKRRQKKKVAPPPAPKVAAPAPAVTKPAPQEMPELTRVELIQKLWGDGFSLPGGKEFALRVAAPVNFIPGGRYLDLAPGLGGGMRAVAAAGKVTISGIEADDELAATGHALSDSLGMGGTAPIRPVGPEGLGPEDFRTDGGYQAIFMREAMFAVEERERMLAELWEALTEDGSLVLTDFVFADGVGSETEESPAVIQWRAAEGQAIYPWTMTEYRDAFASQDYKLERMTDLTSVYLPFIQAGWRQFHDCLQNAKLPPETATTLIREANIWLARSQALETNQLRLVHIHVQRAHGSANKSDEAEQMADGAELAHE